MPGRRDLDALGFDRPVVVVHYTLHQCVVNSIGLDELKIGRTTPDPPDGVIARGTDGLPSGLLIERAWSAAHAQSMAAYRDPERWSELYAARMRQLLRDGITCVHDAACAPSAEAVYRSMRKAGTLPISVLMMPHGEAILLRPPDERLDGPATGEGDEWLRTGPVKLFADGGIAPAMDVSVAGQRSAFGIEFPGLAEAMIAALERGFRVAVHAIGNVGLRNALDAFRRAERFRRDDDHRFRVEHACLASRPQIRDMAALGAIGVVQPGFIDHIGRAVEGVPFDEEIWLPFGDLTRAGIPLAASSDDPCAFHEPLLTASRGTTRITGSGGILGPDQALSYEEWLRLYTAGAAYAGGQEHERGTLTPGQARRSRGPGRSSGRRASPARGADVGGRRARVPRGLNRPLPNRGLDWKIRSFVRDLFAPVARSKRKSQHFAPAARVPCRRKRAPMAGHKRGKDTSSPAQLEM